MFNKWALRKSLETLIKRINNGKRITEKSKGDQREKNIEKLRQKYIKSVKELEDFFEIEKNPEDMTLEELDETLNGMIRSLADEYNVDIKKLK